jgi:hypothetical protein
MSLTTVDVRETRTLLKELSGNKAESLRRLL